MRADGALIGPQGLFSNAATVPARPGDKLLLYGTGGLAYGNVDYSAQTNFGTTFFHGSSYPVNFTETKTGWTAGGGIEYGPSALDVGVTYTIRRP